MENISHVIIAGIFGILVAIATAYITAKYKTRNEIEKEIAKFDFEKAMLQNYSYLLPFKYFCFEFLSRLSHIKARLKGSGEKHENMVRRFDQEPSFPKTLDWYFRDEIGKNGGYFLVSTIYMTCILFYWLRRIQWEYPYIPLMIGSSSDKSMKEYNKYCSDPGPKAVVYISNINEKCFVYDFIKNIKIALCAEHGIPYALLDSFGDFISEKANGNRVKNYEEFSKELIDETARSKYSPVIRFWLDIIPVNGIPANVKLEKIQVTCWLLEMLQDADIRELPNKAMEPSGRQ